MRVDVNDTLKAVAATLDEIERVLAATESWISGEGPLREELNRARDRALRAIDELERLSGK
jgi:hypothetical protein